MYTKAVAAQLPPIFGVTVDKFRFLLKMTMITGFLVQGHNSIVIKCRTHSFENFRKSVDWHIKNRNI